eukprot:4090497-Ditylum_brightwellii.AAC.1
MVGASACAAEQKIVSESCELRRASSGVSVSSTRAVSVSSRASSMKGSSATPCQAQRLPFMSTSNCTG